MSEDWRALGAEAARYLREGRWDDAVAAFQRLVAVRPDHADSWFNLGFAQRHCRRYEEALASYACALGLGLNAPQEAYVNRASILSDHLHRPVEAIDDLLQALAIDPAYVTALLNLGNLYEDLGKRDAAREQYVKALAIEPANTLALARLATSSLGPQLDEGLLTRLKAAISRPTATAAQKAGVGFAIAAVLDAAGHYDEAFEAASAANTSSRETGGQSVSYDRMEHEQFVDQSIAAFTGRSSIRYIGPAPIFICGMYRSGSTLVEQIIAGHSQAASGGELDLVPALAASIVDYPCSVSRADPRMIETWRRFYLGGLPETLNSSVVFTDKRPDNFLHLGLIKTIFPTARIIHTHRNPLDNLLSLHFLHLDPSMAYALDLSDSAHWYGHYRRLMDHWKSIYAGDIFDLRYEDLIENPESLTRELLGFCGLEWENECLDFSRPGRLVKTASVWQVREPLHNRSRGRWRNYAPHLKPLRDALAEQGVHESGHD